jgi:transposase InsO family protein
MPWKETSAVDERMQLVVAVQQGASVAQAARRFGVSRVTAHKWLSRYEAEGPPGLCDRSRAPHRHPNATGPAVVDRILALRDEWMWGPVKLRNYLLNTEPDLAVPAASTIGQLLKDHGRSVPRRRRHVAPHTQPLAHCDRPNRVWCADFKGWFRTADGQRCDPLTISDGYSRYLLCCQIVPRTTRQAVDPLFDAAFREFGMPWAIRTDNGVPFAATRGLGLSRLAVKWIKCGITPERIRPGNPQENGRHERMHRTLKQHTLRPPASTWRRQQRRFDQFRDHYNQVRPHQALDHQPPERFYEPSPRPFPSRIPEPEYPSDLDVRRVYTKGSFYWNGHLLHLSEALDNEYIALAPGPVERYLTIYFGHVPIAFIDTKYARVLHKLPRNATKKDRQ